MDYTTILTMAPMELAKWLNENYTFVIPDSIDSIDQMKQVSRILSELTNSYAYMMQLLNYAKIMVRQEKRKGKENKENYENMIDRRDILQNVADILKMQYQTVSRMITVKKEINEELKMTSCI